VTRSALILFPEPPDLVIRRERLDSYRFQRLKLSGK